MNKAKILDMYNQGYRNKEIANALNLRLGEVNYFVAKNITRQDKPSKYEIRQQAVVAMHRASIDVPTIAQMLHIGESSVLARLRREGIIMRDINADKRKMQPAPKKGVVRRIKGNDARVKRDLKIKELWERGLSYGEISRELKISRGMVASVKNRFGYGWRRQHVLDLSPISTG